MCCSLAKKLIPSYRWGSPIPSFQNSTQVQLPFLFWDKINSYPTIWALYASIVTFITLYCDVFVHPVCLFPLLDWVPWRRGLLFSLNWNPTPSTDPGTQQHLIKICPMGDWRVQRMHWGMNEWVSEWMNGRKDGWVVGGKEMTDPWVVKYKYDT